VLLNLGAMSMEIKHERGTALNRNKSDHIP
jgi:hypothetical protein